MANAGGKASQMLTNLRYAKREMESAKKKMLAVVIQPQEAVDAITERFDKEIKAIDDNINQLESYNANLYNNDKGWVDV